MEESTTESTAVDTGAEEAQPATAVDDSAATTEESTTTSTDDSTEASTEAAANPDENLAWLKGKGIDPTDPEAMAKVAKMYRDAEKAMHSSTQEASELKKALSTPQEGATQQQQEGADPVATLAAEVQSLKLAQNVNTFFGSTPDAKQYEAQMASIVTENPTIGTLVKAGYLNVSDLYNMARGADPKREEQLKQDGGREALQKVADKQQGRAVQGQATSSAFGDEQKKDPFREALLGHL